MTDAPVWAAAERSAFHPVPLNRAPSSLRPIRPEIRAGLKLNSVANSEKYESSGKTIPIATSSFPDIREHMFDLIVRSSCDPDLSPSSYEERR